MTQDTHSSDVSQRRGAGLTLVGLLFVILIVAGIGVPVMKVVPTLIEYRTITSALESIKASGGGNSVMRATFDRTAALNDISSIRGQDLIIENANGGAPELRFAYSKKISIYGPVSLLLDYSGSTARP